MMLYEDFKLYETLWNDLVEEQVTADDDKTINKLSLAQYFDKITNTRAAAITFIKDTLTKYKTRHVADAYNHAMAKESSGTKIYEVAKDPEHNYDAFLKALSVHGLNAKDIRSICTNGEPKANAFDVFDNITATADSVKNFMKDLGQQYKDYTLSRSRQVHQFAYSKWFIHNTNATGDLQTLIPKEVSWSYFVQTCEQKFGYVARDLTRLFRGEDIVDRSLDTSIEQQKFYSDVESGNKASLPEYFDTITSSVEEVTNFICTIWAPYALARTRFDLSSSYATAVAKKTNAHNVDIGTDRRYNYRAFKKKIFDNFGMTTGDIIKLIKNID